MEPNLQFIDRFKEILANYRPSSQITDLLAGVKMITLSSPSAVGRSTVTKELIKTGKYHYIVSDTTRPPRSNDGSIEKDGVDYWFKTEEEFLNGLKSGQYLEAEIIHGQQVSGTNLSELLKAKSENKALLLDIDINGVNRISALMPNITSFFIIPPSLIEWIRRLESRGVMDKSEKEKRLKTAVAELRYAIETPNYVYVVNDNLAHTVETIESIATSVKPNEEQQISAKHLAQELADELESYINQKNFN